jgi:hypothetical protein
MTELKPCLLPKCNGEVQFCGDEPKKIPGCSGCHLLVCTKCKTYFDLASNVDPSNLIQDLTELREVVAKVWNDR